MMFPNLVDRSGLSWSTWLSADCCSSALEEIQFAQVHAVLEDVVVAGAVWSNANDRPNLRGCDVLRIFDSLPPIMLA